MERGGTVNVTVESRLEGDPAKALTEMARGYPGVTVVEGPLEALDPVDVVIVGDRLDMDDRQQEICDLLDRGNDVISLSREGLAADGNDGALAARAVAVDGRVLSTTSLRQVAIEAVALALSLASHRTRQIQIEPGRDPSTAEVRITGEPTIKAELDGFGLSAGAAVILRAARILGSLPAGLHSLGDLPAIGGPARNRGAAA